MTRRRRVMFFGAVLVVSACSSGGSTGETNASGPSSGTGVSGLSVSAPRSSAAIAGRTSCTSVRYIGDSVSVGLVSPKQLPEPGDRLAARLAAVGVTQLSVDASGGRSAAERFDSRPNALDVMPANSHYTGCYIIAIGTNDAANINSGSLHTAHERIEAVMARAHGRPVLWPTVVAQEHAPPGYTPAAMKAFNAELVAATRRHPNLRVYDWAGERDERWTEGDGIHDRRIGSRSRAVMYARALTVAFPAGAPSSSARVVGSIAGRPISPTNAVRLSRADGDASAGWSSDAAALVHYTSGPPMT